MKYEDYMTAIAKIVADPDKAEENAKALLGSIKEDLDFSASQGNKITELEGKLSEARFANFQRSLGNPPEVEQEPTMEEKIAAFREKLNKEGF